MSVSRRGCDTRWTRSTEPSSPMTISITLTLLLDWLIMSGGGGNCGYSIFGGFIPSSALV